MWEMQQLGRRAGALDVDLMSNQLGEMAFSSSAQGLNARKDGGCSRAAPSRLSCSHCFPLVMRGGQTRYYGCGDLL